MDKPLVMHSDRGIQYVCTDYMKATKDMINSYPKKAYPWDNACIESFHALIKRGNGSIDVRFLIITMHIV